MNTDDADKNQIEHRMLYPVCRLPTSRKLCSSTGSSDPSGNGITDQGRANLDFLGGNSSLTPINKSKYDGLIAFPVTLPETLQLCFVSPVSLF